MRVVIPRGSSKSARRCTRERKSTVMSIGRQPDKQWTWRKIWRRAAAVLQQEGLKSLWFKVLGETVYRRAVLMDRLLDEPIAEMPSRVPVIIGLLKETEVQDYLALRPDADPVEI